MKKLNRRFVTLIEMMIVMVLIALIMGVVGYNFQGALEKGYAFKTETGREKLETILNLAVAENASILDDLETTWKGVVADSPLVRNPENLIKDGWGVEYDVSVENGRITVKSEKYDAYEANRRAK